MLAVLSALEEESTYTVLSWHYSELTYIAIETTTPQVITGVTYYIKYVRFYLHGLDNRNKHIFSK